MPVILTTPAEWDHWLEPDTLDALALQRSLPDERYGSLRRARRETGSPKAAL
jgi:putative SOS response-associated peptidase YedK